MLRNRPTTTGGLALIALGLIFLLNYFLPATWPLVIFGLGVFFAAAAFIWRRAELTITGGINMALGGILFYQAITQNWASWYYLWPVLFSAVGAGMLAQRLVPANRGPAGGRYLRVSVGLLVAGLLFALGLWYYRALLDWPSILWGMGALFLVVALASGVGPLAVPGTILGGLGLLLSWQNNTGNWSSWAYAWALLPAFVGLGLFFGFLRHRVVRVVGLSLIGWSLVVFLIFGLFFAEDGLYARFWPVALIMGGVMILLQALLTAGRRSDARVGQS